ncbi:MAG TPA: hypothetical protein DDY43_04200 [Synechococcales bacterium UBA10510]|nr:hypothetical protein [Synechococcales bacterium UBA10510]
MQLPAAATAVQAAANDQADAVLTVGSEGHQHLGSERGSLGQQLDQMFRQVQPEGPLEQRSQGQKHRIFEQAEVPALELLDPPVVTPWFAAHGEGSRGRSSLRTHCIDLSRADPSRTQSSEFSYPELNRSELPLPQLMQLAS